MSRDRGDLRETWRGFYRSQCEDDIRQLADAYPQERSLYVDVLDLYEYDGEFTKALFSDPDRFLNVGADTLSELAEGFRRVNVRLTNHPGLLGIDRLRSRHVSELVTVEGVAGAVGGIQSAVAIAVFECLHCGESVRRRPTRLLRPPTQCPACGAGGPLELDREQSTFVDVQQFDLGAAADSRPEGDGSWAVPAVLDDDLVGAVRGGDRLLVTGIVRLDREGAANRFDFYLDVNALDEEPGEVPGVTDISSDLQQAIESRWELLTSP